MNYKNYINILKNIELFNEIGESELEPLLSCLSAKLKHYGKGEYIYQAGDSVSKFGIVLSGQVQLVVEDYYGNKSILMQMGRLICSAKPLHAQKHRTFLTMLSLPLTVM
jgi:signal-transduction protein with cAMP-binding, CBS, and nucleotidyltransferase domain